MYIFLSFSGPMSANPVRRKYSRHIDVRRHYIREQCLGRLRLLTYDSTFLEPQAVMQIESLFPIGSDRKYWLGDHKNCGACALTRAEILITYALSDFLFAQTSWHPYLPSTLLRNVKRMHLSAMLSVVCLPCAVHTHIQSTHIFVNSEYPSFVGILHTRLLFLSLWNESVHGHTVNRSDYSWGESNRDSRQPGSSIERFS